jgi:isocitrate dehydrogenase (NAD+)
MVHEGRAAYADPSSIIRAGAMLLQHIGYTGRARKLDMALDICGQFEKKLVMTGRPTGASAQEFGDYIMRTVERDDLEAVWRSYQP